MGDLTDALVGMIVLLVVLAIGTFFCAVVVGLFVFWLKLFGVIM